MGNDNLIEVNKLSKNYKGIPALNDLTFSITTKGGCHALIGPNGAGKSTLLNLITGYLMPSSGTVYIKDIDRQDDPVECAKSIGYLPENLPLYPEMSCSEYLDYLQELKTGEKNPEEIENLVERFKLEPVYTRQLKNLSKGYKQRIGLAQALIGNPQIIILDEPMNGLDPSQIKEFRQAIQELKKDHVILFSTHILSEVEQIADSLLILHEGELIVHDTVDKLTKKLSKKSMKPSIEEIYTSYLS